MAGAEKRRSAQSTPKSAAPNPVAAAELSDARPPGDGPGGGAGSAGARCVGAVAARIRRASATGDDAVVVGVKSHAAEGSDSGFEPELAAWRSTRWCDGPDRSPPPGPFGVAGAEPVGAPSVAPPFPVELAPTLVACGGTVLLAEGMSGA